MVWAIESSNCLFQSFSTTKISPCYLYFAFISNYNINKHSMIGAYGSGYSSSWIIDLILFICAIPFGFCDLYYAHRDFTCVWASIANTSINFNLRRWLLADGGIILAFTFVILVIGFILCCFPVGCELLWWIRNVLGFIFALWRLAWLIVGSIMFWGYLWRYNFCGRAVSGFMWANLIFGFVHSFVYFFLPCFCCQPNSIPFGAGSVVGGFRGSGVYRGSGVVGVGAVGYGGSQMFRGSGVYRGSGVAGIIPTPLPVVTPSYRGSANIIYWLQNMDIIF